MNGHAAQRATRYLLALATTALLAAPPAAVQLRPLDPFEWRLYEPGPVVAVEAGAAVLTDQRAALAGTEGRLFEAGTFRAFWRTGRVVFEAAGTAQRFFREERSFAPPAEQLQPAPDGRRHDSGDYLVISTVRLTRDGAPVLGIIRFGTRLPTTDNRQGLERDMTDFFALIGGRLRHRRLLVGAETGVSINGTRDPEFRQKDVLPYILRAEYELDAVIAGLTVTGDVLGPRFRELRGNEPLGEARFGVRTTGRSWLRAEVIAGYRTYSPRAGLRVVAGRDW